MTLAEILLAIVLSLPAPWYRPGKNPETPSDYNARLETIAKAIAIEAEAAEDWRWDANSLAAATLVIWYGESRFALEVHNGAGKSRYGEDDGRARCFGQLHQTGLVPKDEWDKLAGIDLEATRRCARFTMKVLSVQGRRCGMTLNKPNMWEVARMVSAYGSGKKSCAPTKDSTARARRWTKVMARIKAAGSPETLAATREDDGLSKW
jgi:hypothetical protein